MCLNITICKSLVLFNIYAEIFDRLIFHGHVYFLLIVTVTNIRALLGVYYGVKKPDATSKVVMKTEQASMSEDEGEVISSDEDGDEGSVKPEPIKAFNVKEEKDDAKKIK